MRYTCDDFRELRYAENKKCSVGMFGDNIYAMRYFSADGHNSYHSEYYNITQEEFAGYPLNSEELITKYYKGHVPFLCSDYSGKTHTTYYFDR